MRDQVNVLYYPDYTADPRTLKKAILFFDEIHFMDRPRYVFEGGLGSAAAERSPLRDQVRRFQAAGIPMFVHWTLTGPVIEHFWDEVAADVSDLQFLLGFQQGLRESESFRRLQVMRDDDGDPWMTEEDLVRLSHVDLTQVVRTPADALALLQEPDRYPPDLRDPQIAARLLVYAAAICSAKIYNGLSYGGRNGFQALADAAPYGDLQMLKSARAIQDLEKDNRTIPITNLSFSIFDEIVPAAAIDRMTIQEAIQYRHASSDAREEFLEYLVALRDKSRLGTDGDLGRQLDRLIAAEVLPAARAFGKKIRAINEAFFSALVKGSVGALGGISGLQVLGDISWPKIISLAGAAGAYVAQSGIDAILAVTAAQRESSLTYLLSLR